MFLRVLKEVKDVAILSSCGNLERVVHLEVQTKVENSGP